MNAMGAILSGSMLFGTVLALGGMRVLDLSEGKVGYGIVGLLMLIVGAVVPIVAALEAFGQL